MYLSYFLKKFFVRIDIYPIRRSQTDGCGDSSVKYRSQPIRKGYPEHLINCQIIRESSIIFITYEFMLNICLVFISRKYTHTHQKKSVINFMDILWVSFI